MSALTAALSELRNAGAIAVPNEITVKKAKKGKVFSGKKDDGGFWSLTKNNEDSYNCMC